MAPQPELDIEGLIDVLEWVPEVTAKGIWGMSGSLGGDRSFPAHYRVELVDCNVALAEGEIEPAPNFWPGLKVGKQEKYSLTLNHPADDAFLKPGMRIKVLGYNVSGDEGGIWTTYRNIATETALIQSPEVTTDKRCKVELDLSKLDDDGLQGPPDGKVALSYEFSIPDSAECKAEVKAIDQTVQFMPGSSGRVGASKNECLCIGATHQKNYRQVIERLAELSYIKRIIACHFE